MPRAAQKKGDSGIYHVMLRGINRQIIFEDDEDCEKYLQCLAECRQISGFTLHAYCLMGNHLHLLLEENTEPMEQVFKRVGARYVFGIIGSTNEAAICFKIVLKANRLTETRIL